MSSVQRRLDDLARYQIPQLSTITNESAHADALQGIKDDFGLVTRDIEEMELEAMDLETQAERTAATREVQHLQTVLASLRVKFREAALTSKRRLDSQAASARRNDLLKSSAATSKVVKEQGGSNEDALMSATSDVTDSLRQTMSMMQQELDRSVLSNQMLEQSSATLRLTNEQYSTLSIFLNTSKALISSLEQADMMDRLLMGAALLFFILVCLFIIKRRILDKGLRVMNVLLNVGRSKNKREAVQAVTSSLSSLSTEEATALSTIATTIASLSVAAKPTITASASQISPLTPAPSSVLSSPEINFEPVANEPVPIHEIEPETEELEISSTQDLPQTTSKSILVSSDALSTSAPPPEPEEAPSDLESLSSIDTTSSKQDSAIGPKRNLTAELVKVREAVGEGLVDDVEVILAEAKRENVMDDALEEELERARLEVEDAQRRMAELRRRRGQEL